jgi:hypothetical protein
MDNDVIQRYSRPDYAGDYAGEIRSRKGV